LGLSWRAFELTVLSLAVACAHNPMERPWVRLHHPVYPFSFELPEKTKQSPEPYVWGYGAGSLRDKYSLPQRVFYYDYRNLNWWSPIFALTLSFALVSHKNDLAEPGTLRALYEEAIAGGVSADRALSFYNSVFQPPSNFPIHDIGPFEIGGVRGRHLQGPPPTPRYHTVADLFILPVSGTATLVARFLSLPETTAVEREQVVPRILESIQFDRTAAGR
jgi:hypothetical protein